MKVRTASNFSPGIQQVFFASLWTPPPPRTINDPTVDSINLLTRRDLKTGILFFISHSSALELTQSLLPDGLWALLKWSLITPHSHKIPGGPSDFHRRWNLRSVNFILQQVTSVGAHF